MWISTVLHSQRQILPCVYATVVHFTGLLNILQLCILVDLIVAVIQRR